MASHALKKVKSGIERVFDKNLHDLVRGIRNNKENETQYISACLEEIKQELRQDNIAVKANAVSKLCYLQVLFQMKAWEILEDHMVVVTTVLLKKTMKRMRALGALTGA